MYLHSLEDTPATTMVRATLGIPVRLEERIISLRDSIDHEFQHKTYQMPDVALHTERARPVTEFPDISADALIEDVDLV